MGLKFIFKDINQSTDFRSSGSDFHNLGATVTFCL